MGQSEFDLPGTSVSASRSRPDTQLVINLDTLGRSDVTMPGDDVGMEVEAVTGVHTVTSRPLSNVGSTLMQLASAADMEEELTMTSASVHVHGSQVPRPKRWKRTKNQAKKDKSFSRHKTTGP